MHAGGDAPKLYVENSSKREQAILYANSGENTRPGIKFNVVVNVVMKGSSNVF